MKWISRFPHLVAVAVTCAALVGPTANNADACGTFEFWAERSGKAVSGRTLRQLMCVDYNTFVAEKHARLLFNVILQAVQRDKELKIAGRLFHKYECLPSMRGEDGYARILSALGAQRCTPEGFFRTAPRNLFVVNVRNAQLRFKPSRHSSTVDRVQRDSIVRKLETIGEWVRVKTRWGNVGYIQAAQLRAYMATPR